MKKAFPTICCILIGFFLGFLFLRQYKTDNIKVVSKEENILYFIQIGAYSSFENMQQSVKDFYNYIYEEEDGKYYAYVAIIKNQEILNKIKEFFSSLGYVIYVKEKYINNKAFNEVLSQYELLLSETSDKDTIMTIFSQIVSKYEDLELSD